MTASYAFVAVNAVSTTVLKSYKNYPLDRNHNFEDVSYMHGYFETGNSSHKARAGTHYNVGSLYGRAYTYLYYYPSGSNTPTRVVDIGRYIVKNSSNWICAPWVTVDKSYTSAQSIIFWREKMNNAGTVLYRERINVNR